MIHFAILAGAPQTVDRLRTHLSRALASTSYFIGRQTQLVAADRTWAVAAITTPDPTSDVRLVGDPGAMVVFNGPALSAAGDQRELGTSVLEAFRSGGSAGIVDVLGGTYNLVGASPERGVHAFGDFSGLSPLYWHQSPEVAIFSNRSTTVARLAGTWGWDQRALAWLIGHANLFGDRMPARDVAYLPPGCEAVVAPGSHQVDLVRAPTWVWPGPTAESGRDDLPAETWDRLTDDLVTTFRSFGTFREPLRLGLTGGKDSRLCLAVAKAAGLRDNLDVGTNGRPGSPEVEVAAAVAEAAGFPHRHTGPPAPPNASQPVPHLSGERIWRRLRQHAYRYDATVCPWDGTNDRLTRVVVAVKGFGGELYRGPGGHAKRFKQLPGDLDGMADMFVDYHQPHDPLEILDPAELQYQEEWLRRWVYETADHVRFDLLPLKFYVDYRLGHWNGPMSQAKAGRIDFNPLLSTTVASQVFELSPRACTEERLHYEVMRRTAPELLSVPFLGDTWAQGLARQAPERLPTTPYETTVTPTPQALSAWQWAFLSDQRRGIDALFADAQHQTAMGDIVDMTRLRRCVRDGVGDNGVVKAKQVLSSVCVALTLLGRTEPVTDAA